MNQKRLQELYKFFLEQRGEPTFSKKVDNQVILNWENKLPSSLLHIWQGLGWCSFYNGLLWIVNPDEYQYLMDTCLENTKYQQLDNFYCIARTAFGEYLLYGERTKRIIEIQSQYNNFAHKNWGIPKNYILFTTGEGEDGYFYNVDDNSV